VKLNISVIPMVLIQRRLFQKLLNPDIRLQQLFKEGDIR